MRLVKNIDREELYYNYYKSLSQVMNLTYKEVNILAELCKISNDRNYLYTSEDRKIVASNLNISIYNFNNYIRSLRDKKILSIVKTSIYMNPSIRLKDGLDEYEINIKLNIKK